MGYIQKFPDNKVLFTLCDCQSEILYIEYDPEIDMADFAIFQTRTSQGLNMSFWQRMRYIFRVLVYGKPYADQMMINRKQLIELRRFLNEILL